MQVPQQQPKQKAIVINAAMSNQGVEGDGVNHKRSSLTTSTVGLENMNPKSLEQCKAINSLQSRDTVHIIKPHGVGAISMAPVSPWA